MDELLKPYGIRPNRKSVQRLRPAWNRLQDGNEHSFADVVMHLWGAYSRSRARKSNALNGAVFEMAFLLSLLRSDIKPLYFQAEFTLIPNVMYDFVFFTATNQPLAISLKTSLRERYKQADLEALALKSVFRGAKAYLLTLDQKAQSEEQYSSNKLLGLDKVIYCDQQGLSFLQEQLRRPLHECQTISMFRNRQY